MKFVRAEREREWMLHLESLREMVPYFFSAGHVHYARYATYYHRPMLALPAEVRQYFMEGQQVMRNNPYVWNGIWSDMYIETTFMRYGHARKVIHSREDLYTTHEEADTIVIQQMIAVSRENPEVISVVSDDTDRSRQLPRFGFSVSANSKPWRVRGDVVVRLPASHLGEPGSIPGGVALGYKYVGIVPDDATGRGVFSGISRFPRPPFSAVLYSPHSPSPALKTWLLRTAQISSLLSKP
ncbi:hypothetical protein PR048_007329 [Dryococelus australis]|uniref:Uncharacterized protein n=1 Tax=Dryococelus australis TaxID=614101 RepID=A0ABQ9IDA8_9NEOP|nr:hypothetical protein PR048_007329 [Dryococelus australis]